MNAIGNICGNQSSRPLAAKLSSPMTGETFLKTVGGTGYDEGHAITLTADGGFVAVGGTESFGAGCRDLFLTRFDSSGELLWAKTVGGTDYEEGGSITLTADGGFAAVGYTGSFGDAGGGDLFLTRFDSSGELLWAKTIGGAGVDDGVSITPTADGGFAAVGGTQSSDPGYGDLFLSRFDSSGELLWAKTVGGIGNNDCGYSITPTADGGFAAVGWTTSFGAGYKDLFLARFDEMGNIPGCDNVVDCSPTVIDVSPSVLDVTPTITSLSLTAVDCAPAVLDVTPEKFDICVGLTVEEQVGALPQRTTLNQNSPNPFNSRTQISYTLPEAGEVLLEIIDISGRRVAALEEGQKSAGEHLVVWEPEKDASSGIYFCRLKAGPEVQVKKMALIK